MIFFNKTNKKERVENIVLNSSNFIKSLNLSNKPDNEFIGYNLYLEIVAGIKRFDEGKLQSKDYIKDALYKAFNLPSTSEYDKIINQLNNNKRIVGENTEFTVSSLIKRWMEIQDNFLIPSFKETMGYSDTLIEQINNSLTSNELKFAENILFDFYENYLMGHITGLSLDEITRQEYGLNYTTGIPFKKYSYTQLINDKLWEDDIYKYREENDDEEDSNEEEYDDYIKIGDEKVREKLESLMGGVLNEVSRCFYCFDSEYKNNVIKYPILEVGIFDSLNKYIYELEAFKNLTKQKVDFLVVFDNNDIRQKIKKNHGKKKHKYLLELIEGIYYYATSNSLKKV